MKDLLAKKPSELAICLKLLYARGIDFNVELEEVNGTGGNLPNSDRIASNPKVKAVVTWPLHFIFFMLELNKEDWRWSCACRNTGMGKR